MTTKKLEVWWAFKKKRTTLFCTWQERSIIVHSTNIYKMKKIYAPIRHKEIFNLMNVKLMDSHRENQQKTQQWLIWHKREYSLSEIFPDIRIVPILSKEWRSNVYGLNRRWHSVIHSDLSNNNYTICTLGNWHKVGRAIQTRLYKWVHIHLMNTEEWQYGETKIVGEANNKIFCILFIMSLICLPPN